MSNCNLCGEPYAGMAGDCACTMFGYTYVEDIPAELLEAYRRGQAEKKRRELRYKAWRLRNRMPRWLWYGGMLILGMVLGALIW